MKFLKSLAILASPAKAEFTKRLIQKRRSYSPLLAGMARLGSPEYSFRRIGLESAEYLVAPESTLATALEHLTSLMNSSHYQHVEIEAKTVIARQKYVQDICGQADARLTKKPNAAALLPEFRSITQYLRYATLRDHPKSGLDAETLSDEFLEYALSEAKYVYR